ncbi:MAG: CoA pyrophosphatase [Tepidibacter sp.]|jgi:8-oxo-dGTP pyrophosphatase MutT (NUDIX family)|uniref:NUDIX hydrolase n=1 Tax=Tepidibacter sp. TaxID=2529387 RepID=UPI0025DDBFB8|nr:CoA pyrophosphatase [Tepidibacter sp.]MCT4507502.1 CoA pyrophosphatase [Tepidibacter sp.]
MIEKITSSFFKFKPQINNYKRLSKASVLIPLIQKDSDTFILFEVRSKNLNTSPSEISFPGGKFDTSDITLERTVIRETCEELGLSKNNISIITPLNILVTPFNMLIHPFLGTIDNYNNININISEVDHTFLVPLDFFINTTPKSYKHTIQIHPCSDFPYDLIPNGQNYKFKEGVYDTLIYEYKNYVIWGITARIIKDFIDTIKENLHL